MTQKTLPGNVVDTVSSLKRRVSKLERDLTAVRREGAVSHQVIAGTRLHPSGLINPGGPPDNLGALVWHPTGGNLLSVTVFAGIAEADEESTPVDATVSIFAGRQSQVDDFSAPFVKSPSGADLERLPYSTWYDLGKIETARTWIPPLTFVGLAMAAPAHFIIVFGALFEFDTGPRERTA